MECIYLAFTRKPGELPLATDFFAVVLFDFLGAITNRIALWL